MMIIRSRGKFNKIVLNFLYYSERSVNLLLQNLMLKYVLFVCSLFHAYSEKIVHSEF